MSALRVRAASDSFTVTWEDREEAATYWGFDQEHAPQPLVPMAQDLAARWYDHALSMRVVIVNGYLYAADDEEAFPELPATEQSRPARELWEILYEPPIRSRLAALREIDLDPEDLPAR